MTRFLAFLIAIIVSFNDALHAKDEIVLSDPNFQRIETYRYIEVAEWSPSLISIDDVLRLNPTFKLSEKAAKNVLLKHHSWLKLNIINSTTELIPAVLLHNSGSTLSVDVYSYTNKSASLIDRNGRLTAFSKRAINFRKPATPINLNPGLNTFFIKVDNEGIQSHYFSLLTPKEFHNYSVRDTQILSIVSGIFIFAILYNIFFYFQVRYSYMLVYSLHCVAAFATYTTLIGIVNIVFTDLESTRDIQTLTLIFAICTTVSGYFFARQYLKTYQYSKAFDNIIRFFSYSYILVFMLVAREYFTPQEPRPASMLCALIPIFSSPILLLASLVIFMKGYKPAIYFAIAWLPLIVSTTVSLLVSVGVLPWVEKSDLFGLIGGSIEVILLSLAIGYRVRIEVEKHIHHLDDLVREKAKKIRFILDHVQIGIFKINENGCIDSEYSKSCSSIFDKKFVSGVPFEDVYIANRGCFSLSDAEYSAMSAIKMMLGESSLSFEINENTLPKEIISGEKYIALEWSAIVDNSIVNGFLVTAKDVTYMKNLEESNKNSINEIRLLSSIEGKGKERILDYIASEKDFVISNLTVVNNMHAESHSDFALQKHAIMRDLHTIKGNSRSFGLDKVSDLAHLSETTLKDCFTSDGFIDQARIVFRNIHDSLDDYLHTIKKYTSHHESDKRNDAFYSLCLDNLNVAISHLPAYIAHSLEPVSGVIKSFLGTSLDLMLRSAGSDLTSICCRLGKDPPKVHIVGTDIYIKREYVHKVRSIFIHLMRNSIDHGIETAEERKIRNKPLIGNIFVKVAKIGTGYTLLFWDDGKGLKIKKIYRKALLKGLIDDVSRFNVAMVSDFIFLPGFTTSESVSDVSGRGVGMDAVRYYLKEIGADMSITFDDPIARSTPAHEFERDTIEFKYSIRIPWNVTI